MASGTPIIQYGTGGGIVGPKYKRIEDLQTKFNFQEEVWGKFIPITWGIVRQTGTIVWSTTFRVTQYGVDVPPAPERKTNYWKADFVITQTEHTHGFAIGRQSWTWIGPDPQPSPEPPLIQGMRTFDGCACVTSQIDPPYMWNTPLCVRTQPDPAEDAYNAWLALYGGTAPDGAIPFDPYDQGAGSGTLFQFGEAGNTMPGPIMGGVLPSPYGNQIQPKNPLDDRELLVSFAASFGYSGHAGKTRVLQRLFDGNKLIYDRGTNFYAPNVYFVFHEGNLGDLPDSQYIKDKGLLAVPFRQQVYVAFRDYSMGKYTDAKDALPEITAEFYDKTIPTVANAQNFAALPAPWELFGAQSGIDFAGERFFHVVTPSDIFDNRVAIAEWNTETRELIGVHELPSLEGKSVNAAGSGFRYIPSLDVFVGTYAPSNAQPVAMFNPHTGALIAKYGRFSSALEIDLANNDVQMLSRMDGVKIGGATYIFGTTQLSHEAILFRQDGDKLTPLETWVVNPDFDTTAVTATRDGFLYTSANNKVGKVTISFAPNGSPTFTHNNNFLAVDLGAGRNIRELISYNDDIVLGGDIGGTANSWKTSRYSLNGARVWETPGFGASGGNLRYGSRQVSDLSGGSIVYGESNSGNLKIIDLANGNVISATTGVTEQISAWDSFNNVYYTGGGGSIPAKKITFTGPDGANGVVTLAEFLRDLCVIAGYEAADVEISGIDDTILGAQILQPYKFEELINDICRLYRINRVESGNRITFNRTLTNNSVLEPIASIDVAEIAWLDSNESSRAALSTVRDKAEEIVTQASLTFINPERDYAADTYTYVRPSVPPYQAAVESALSVPIVMSRQTAAVLTQQLLYEDAAASITYEFRLPPRFARIDAGDVIAITHKTYSDIVQITEVTLNADNSLSCLAKRIRTAGRVAISTDIFVGRPSLPVGDPTTDLLIFDTPALTADEDNAGPVRYFAVVGRDPDKWTGGYAAVSRFGSNYRTVVQGRNDQLIAKTLNVIDGDYNTLEVAPLQLKFSKFVTPLPQTTFVTAAQLYADPTLNLAFYGNVGRWEIVQYSGYVSDSISGTTVIDRLIRGRRGTEHLINTHEIGDYFVPAELVATDKATIEGLGVEELFKASGFNVALDRAPETENTVAGENLRPWAPILRPATRDGAGAVVLAWSRRDRRGFSTLGASRPPLALTDTPEAYDVEILDGPGGAVVRTVAGLPLPTYAYSVADQEADGVTPAGEPLTALSVRIFQVSAVVGRGFPREVTLNVA